MKTTRTAHTPGPWHWSGHGLQPATHNPDAHYVHTILVAEEFATGFAIHDWREVRETLAAEEAANLALIAAAPDLYAALLAARAAIVRLQPEVDMDADTDTPERIAAEAVVAINAAIAKAATPQESRRWAPRELVFCGTTNERDRYAYAGQEALT